MAQNCKPVNNFLYSLPPRGVFQKSLVSLVQWSRIVVFESETGVDVDAACLVFAGNK